MNAEQAQVLWDWGRTPQNKSILDIGRLGGPNWEGGQGLEPGSWPCDFTDPAPSFQENVVVPSVGAWAIGSLTAPNLRPCRPSRSATLAARTTWPTAPWTSEPSVFPPFLQEASVPGLQPPCVHTDTSPMDKKPASWPSWPGLFLVPYPPQNYYFCPPSLQLPLKHKPPLSQPCSDISAVSPLIPGWALPSNLQQPSEARRQHLLLPLPAPTLLLAIGDARGKQLGLWSPWLAGLTVSLSLSIVCCSGGFWDLLGRLLPALAPA